MDNDTLHFFAPHNLRDCPLFRKLITVCAWHLVPCKPEILVLEDTNEGWAISENRAPAVLYGPDQFCVGMSYLELMTDEILGSLMRV